MRPALAAVVLSTLLAGAAGASGDAYRLEIKGTGKIALARPHGDGEVSIEMPAEFQATLNLARGDEGWTARDADIKVTVAGQKLRLRLTAPPDNQVYVEINDGPAGWGRREDLAAVPILGMPVTLDVRQLPAITPTIAIPGGTLAIFRLPNGEELLRSGLTLGAPDASAGTRPWSAFYGMQNLEVPGPGESSLLIDHLAWKAEGTVTTDPPTAATAGISANLRLGAPGGLRGEVTVQLQATLTPAETP